MAKLTWDDAGKRFYETGTKMGVLYPFDAKAEAPSSLSKETTGITESKSKYVKGVAWNGLTGVTESPSGADATDLYADDIKYLSIRAAETCGGTIEAYTYPDEFAVLDGTVSLLKGITIGQQSRGTFGFCFRSTVGNDTDLNNYGYKLHLVYGATVSPSERAYATINDSPEAITFSWEFETTPVNFTSGDKTYSTANLIIDVTKLEEAQKKNIPLLEACLYGSDSTEAFLPLPDEVIAILNTTQDP